jgi:DNA-binding NarL/FixJ family response regulator
MNAPHRHDAADRAHQPGDRALRLLRWLAKGHSIDEIAQWTKRPRADIEQHLSALFARLGVSTAGEALGALDGPDASSAGEEPAGGDPPVSTPA